MAWPWKRFVIGMSLAGLCMLLVGARDLSDAWHDGTSVRAAIETMVAGALFIGAVASAVLLKNRRSWKSKPLDRRAANADRVVPDPQQAGHAEAEPAARDRYDDVIDDELSRL
jgi:hypothetical protein